jgi:TonB family protein
MALISAVLVLFVVFAALQLRSHYSRASLPTGKQRPVPAVAGFPPQSPVPGTQSSKGAAVRGAVAERVLPDVPQSASETIHGTVEVSIRVTVDPSGDVSNATFDSPGASKYFANLALQAARDWRFKPAQVDGQAVSSVWILRFQFRQTGTEVTPVEASP